MAGIDGIWDVNTSERGLQHGLPFVMVWPGGVGPAFYSVEPCSMFLITQRHLGDVLPDKIIYDAQTTSGGSGGPLFNRKGKVIGINYAVVRDFWGSNFGIPAGFAQAFLLSRASR